MYIIYHPLTVNMYYRYASDIVDHRRKVEVKFKINVNYMQMQTDINAKMREILVNWLVEVHTKFKLQQETLYLAVKVYIS